MNDFTKEELEDIYEAVMDTSIAMFDYLPSKIQSMIDNYCEHDPKASSISYTNYFCTKCGMEIA